MNLRQLVVIGVVVVACSSSAEPSRPAEPEQPAEDEHEEEGEAAPDRTTEEALEAIDVPAIRAPGLANDRPPVQTLDELAETLGCDPSTAARISPRHAEVLGMLDEYISRFDYYTGEPRPRFIEHFYPHERVAADVFERKLRVTFGRGRRFTRRLAAQGHIEFEGQSVADAINAMYMRVPPEGASIDPCKALGWSDAAARAYLRGMRARFGTPSGGITMANAGAKMAFAAALARKVGLTVDAYYVTDTIPAAYHLKLAGLD